MIYVFGEWELDLRLYELRRAGRTIKLEPQVFNVLAYLVQHHGRVVPRQELLSRLWPDQHIGDSALERCIMSARKAVGDSGNAQGMIKTLHRRGYRFVAPVKERFLETSGFAAASESPMSDFPPQSPWESASLVRHRVPTPRYASHSGELLRPLSTSKKAEHRHVTVLSCALASALTLAEVLGTEAMHDLLDRFFCLALQTVRSYDGMVSQFWDNGFVALFGAALVYDDHAMRAVQAAVELQHHLPECQTDEKALAEEELVACVGLHSGEVVGKRLSGERRVIYMAVGDTMQVAASLQRYAAPGTILISETTYRLVREIVPSVMVGQVPVAANATAVTAYEVLGRSIRCVAEAGHAKRRVM
jgi:DNA-binding winged helix-turn-helix (wHTH) protein/class 3 adenylate cyclase